MTLPHPMFKRSVYVTRLDFFLEETVKKKELYKQANYKACSPPVWNTTPLHSNANLKKQTATQAGEQKPKRNATHLTLQLKGQQLKG